MRVFLVHNEPVFREGLKRVMLGLRDITVDGEAATCHDLPQRLADFDLLVLDGTMDSLSLLQSLNKVRPKGKPPFTLVVAENSGEEHVAQMFAAGAHGYLEKSTSAQIVLDAVRRVGRGGKYVPANLAEKLIFAMNRPPESKRLSQREYQVLYMLGSGLAAKEVAAQLAVSVKTVSTYRSRVMEKLRLRSTADLIRYAIKENIIV
jgi:DNA-binding NarL/FixJ family response regulator